MWALCLGSNHGNRQQNLKQAKQAINSDDISILKESFIYETPALLPLDAPNTWNKNFLNQAILCKTKLAPNDLLSKIKKIEVSMGRDLTAPKWSPRSIDIDILAHKNTSFAEKHLNIPHKDLVKRSFFINPLYDIAPDWHINGQSVKTLKQQSNISKLVQILNLTPDSFSDGGKYQQEESWDQVLQECESHHIAMIDMGAESTRPGAQVLSHEEEWQRIAPALEFFIKHRIQCKLSVDTRHYLTAAKAIEMGVEFINEVSGFADPKMIQLAKSTDQKFIFMHNLGLPADPQKTLENALPPTQHLQIWLENKLDQLLGSGIKKEQLIFDPGIGFGKTAAQSLDLLNNIEAFNDLPLYVGHSRKSFLTGISTSDFHHRDPETLGISFALQQKGVEYLRVHNSSLHHRAFLAYNSVL